jgi:phage N-6-adenine-methyltransferase
MGREELIDRAKQIGLRIRRRQKHIGEEQCELTADKWEHGEFLAELKKRCKRKGDWAKELKAVHETYQRADENIKIHNIFASKEAAGKVNVRRALKMIRKGENPEDDQFVTPAWLYERLLDTYHFTLDAAACADNAKCPNFISPEQDAFKQDWPKLSKGGAVFCNGSFAIIERFVRMGHHEAQSGIVVVMIIPIWHSQDWFKEVVLQFGEIRFIGRKTSYKGSGVKKGVVAGNGIGGANMMETLVVVFRKGQRAFLGEPVIKSSRLEAKV